MRIGLFSWEAVHSVFVGGIGLHVTELACALERKGHEVHIFTRMARQDHPQYECIHGVHYHRCPFSPHPDFIEEVANMCRSFTDAFLATENYIGHFDVIHGHDWLTALALEWINKARRHKTVFTIHSTEYGRCGNNFFEGNSRRVRHLEWRGSYSSDRVITVSNALKNEVTWIYNIPEDKTDVVYNGIRCSDFDSWIDCGDVKRQYGIGPLDPMVLIVGRMVYQKGPDLLVSAIPYILHYYANAKFVFAGDGEMRAETEGQAARMGVAHATRFLGKQSPEALRDLFKSTDCVCVPSRNEPFGIVILEAWSAGKPVVATVNGGPNEIIWHDVNGLKIQDNPQSIAWGIGTLFNDFDHARWMGHNGRLTVETAFSWDVIADETLHVYQ
ncbi:MAG: glycosyltransferase family 4 protein [Candidatus Omnitrophica bacterium]|nr:glycosyltransferase family 4 protein [Candidatus Omnitrophota bacterium]MDE2008619.1 glycosyltransferase family 4 protein [Candidatus Omnitrophota bacterium]MDE2214085.1 glycosyltransferase family 4 protein [Candidatus Omnitrophota bacterium]MDE2230937.1 glycosyltransferase family 4 protein [Candidatus Omnitrophota bacterium]